MCQGGGIEQPAGEASMGQCRGRSKFRPLRSGTVARLGVMPRWLLADADRWRLGSAGRSYRPLRTPPISEHSRGEGVSKVWDYIKAHNLQNPENRREILADDKLKSVFGKDKVTMFEMNKHLAQHLT